ncbi:TraG family conjugative transposon ATPase [Pedobacter sp. SYSU D00535]|uniref:TraG family conjugative transposon ATPase n=1 Tax=Pedobacter sp. SYSU D00535 TaxID=2810308 RepID=UPI001A96A5AA|nr:TraG family conjugative transposon ATPase [Pedobacter sp. SYSU D00535]
MNKVFKLPYVGIDDYQDWNILYTERGDFSLLLKIENPVLCLSADAQAYQAFHQVLMGVIKILGEGYILQKQDLFIRREFQSKVHKDYLQQHYSQHFQGRKYFDLHTYLIITRAVKRNAFYTWNQEVLDTTVRIGEKAFDMLHRSGWKPRRMDKKEIDDYLRGIVAMDPSADVPGFDNIRASSNGLKSSNRELQTIVLADSETLDLPIQVSPFSFKKNNKALVDFPADNFSFLSEVPSAAWILYNQVLELPQQQSLLRKLELKKKRHSSVPDPANKLCVEDISRLMDEVARENRLLVNAHFSILVCATSEDIAKAANFIGSELFNAGIISSSGAYNQLELFRASLPGNAAALKSYDSFLTTAEAAACLFYKEALMKDEHSDFLLHFTDRQGIPIGIDPADLPMQQNRINNRNKFVLGPSGSGKSFFMNAMVEQYSSYNMDVVIVDTGDSYSGLNAYFNGKYITWKEDKPITMNPFLIDRGEYNIEKKDFLCTLIGLLWKGAEGVLTTVERDVIASVVSGYYASWFLGGGSIPELGFNSFYDYCLKRIPVIKKEERIPFDLDEFRYVLKKFYKDGEFGQILNEAADSSLFSAPFIVFEIDAIKENRVLFPIVTLIIMDVFIQKMRHRRERRKVLICEEAWKAIASPLMSTYLLYLYKTVRKFWGEAIVVTQELGDILGNPVVKESILANSDTVCLLDQSKFRDNYDEIARLLAISETEKKKIFTINQLDNREGRSRFKEVYIRRGSSGEVYGVEVSLHQYLVYTTEKPEKTAVEHYVNRFRDYRKGLDAFVSDLTQSGLSLSAFVKQLLQDKQNNY